MKNLSKIYNDAPPIGKIIILLMVCVLAYVIYKVIAKITAKKDTSENALDASTTEISILSQSGEQPTYSNTNYIAWSDRLQEAMNGVGTDEEAIKDVFHFMQNKTDVLKLVKAFGIRDYTDDKFLIWNVKPMNLNEWISAELDATEISDLINKQLTAKQINYQF